MRTAVASLIVASLSLAGCCTSLGPEQGRIDGQEWGDTSVCGIFSGWGVREMPERSEALYTPVTLAEYTGYLCGRIDIEDFATCGNRVERFYRETVERRKQPGDSQSGPFAFRLGDALYTGSYRSDILSASFRVSSDSNSCTGSYNALFGDTEPVYKVRCDNGETGKARIVLDRWGRDGIGFVMMDDGTEGTIIFGPRIAEVARSALF